jgi:RecA/RadA recombinase
MSTGLLSPDMLLGGGIRPNFYTVLGMEQSAKTTSALTIMGSGVKQNIPLIGFYDAEGSTASSLPYVRSILASVGVKVKSNEIFGKKDENGKWVVKPVVRYRAGSELEGFFDFCHSILQGLPDKKKIDKKWWYIFEDTKTNRAKLGDAINTSIAKRMGSKGLYVEAQDDSLQAIIFCDSFPALLPQAQDGDETNKSLALQARAFSQQLPRIKGRMAAKMVAVVGINQLRAIPMAMYGPSESEPGGNALKLYSDARIKHTSRSLSAAPFSPKASKEHNFNETEPSVTVDGGVDVYRYVATTTIKNKLSMPGRKSWIRIWVSDAEGTARGIDPVFDTIFYLKETGQLSGKRAKFSLNLHGLGEAKKPVTWTILKKWILGEKEVMAKISQHLGYKPLSLRKFCFTQMKNGAAEKLYVEYKNSKNKAVEEDDDE